MQLNVKGRNFKNNCFCMGTRVLFKNLPQNQIWPLFNQNRNTYVFIQKIKVTYLVCKSLIFNFFFSIVLANDENFCEIFFPKCFKWV